MGEDEAAIIPGSAAHALYDLLERCTRQFGPSVSVRDALVQALNAEGSDIARSHSAAMGLLNEVAAEIAVLPERRKSRYETYLPEWWTALVQPDRAWSQQSSGVGVSSSALDQLAALSEAVEDRNGRPGNISQSVAQRFLGDLERAETALEELRTVFDASVIDEIRARLIEARWLAERAQLLGLAGAARAAQSAAATAAAGASSLAPQARAENATHLKAIYGLMAALLVYLGAVVPPAIEGTVEIVRIAAESSDEEHN